MPQGDPPPLASGLRKTPFSCRETARGYVDQRVFSCDAMHRNRPTTEGKQTNQPRTPARRPKQEYAKKRVFSCDAMHRNRAMAKGKQAKKPTAHPCAKTKKLSFLVFHLDHFRVLKNSPKVFRVVFRQRKNPVPGREDGFRPRKTGTSKTKNKTKKQNTRRKDRISCNGQIPFRVRFGGRKNRVPGREAVFVHPAIGTFGNDKTC